MNVASVTARSNPYARRLSGRARAFLVALEGFVGLGAIYGGYSLMADAEGLGVETSWLEGTPFPDYTIPGAVLFVVIGGGMLAAAAAAASGNPYAALAAFGMGVTQLVFLAVETLVIGYQGPTQIGLLAMVGSVALVLAAAGSTAMRERPGR